ncbi:MAG: CinA family protein, partial [Acholeplasmatales bacterium]|nr:CinA family protein [Acholeplasmatales bacterium]
MNLEDKLVNILIENNYHIAFAESCTGGLCASKIINVSNASKVINESFITYSNYAKIKYLNVNPNTIEKYGVVSEEVAKEMAIGVAKTSNSEVGISISGIAGPTGETKTKPIGMV